MVVAVRFATRRNKNTIGRDMRLMKIHACWRDQECRSVDAPKRLYINGKRWGILIGVPSQVQLPFKGYTELYSPITLYWR